MPLDPTDCTHGGDCTVHPDARGLHDFTPTIAEALRQVRDYYLYHVQSGFRDMAQSHAAAASAAEGVAERLGVEL